MRHTFTNIILYILPSSFFFLQVSFKSNATQFDEDLTWNGHNGDSVKSREKEGCLPPRDTHAKKRQEKFFKNEIANGRAIELKAAREWDNIQDTPDGSSMCLTTKAESFRKHVHRHTKQSIDVFFKVSTPEDISMVFKLNIQISVYFQNTSTLCVFTLSVL